MPDRIECDEKLLAYVDALIADGRRLLQSDECIDWQALPIDESDRPAAMAEKRVPKRKQDLDYPSAIPVLQFEYGAWRGASYALIAQVVGQEHPWISAFDREVYGACRGCVSAGLGILSGFRTAWNAGVLWSVK